MPASAGVSHATKHCHCPRFRHRNHPHQHQHQRQQQPPQPQTTAATTAAKTEKFATISTKQQKQDQQEQQQAATSSSKSSSSLSNNLCPGRSVAWDIRAAAHGHGQGLLLLGRLVLATKRQPCPSCFRKKEGSVSPHCFCSKHELQTWDSRTY